MKKIILLLFVLFGVLSFSKSGVKVINSCAPIDRYSCKDTATGKIYEFTENSFGPAEFGTPFRVTYSGNGYKNLKFIDFDFE